MNAPAETPKVRKKPLNVSIRAELVAEAKVFGTNVSAVLERALEAEHRQKRRERWQRENREAIEAWNAWVEENGIPFDDIRPW